MASLPGVPGSSGVSLASAVPVRSLAPPLFCPFASVPSSVPVSSAHHPVSCSAYPPFSSSSFPFDSLATPLDLSSAFSFGLPDDLPEDSPLDLFLMSSTPILLHFRSLPGRNNVV